MKTVPIHPTAFYYVLGQWSEPDQVQIEELSRICNAQKGKGIKAIADHTREKRGYVVDMITKGKNNSDLLACVNSHLKSTKAMYGYDSGTFIWHPQEDRYNWIWLHSGGYNSSILNDVNHKVLWEALQELTDNEDYDRGFLSSPQTEHIMIRAYCDAEHKELGLTRAFMTYYTVLAFPYSQYPIIDDDKYYSAIYGQCIETIKDAGRRYLCDNPVENWAGLVYEWFIEDGTEDLDYDSDSEQWYPDEDRLQVAMMDCGVLDPEYYPEDQVNVNGYVDSVFTELPYLTAYCTEEEIVQYLHSKGIDVEAPMTQEDIHKAGTLVAHYISAKVL